MVGADFVSLGLGRFVRADRVLALEPLEGDDRGPGRRTRVWVEGVAQPLIASRSEAAILSDLGSVARADSSPGATKVRAAADQPPSLF